MLEGRETPGARSSAGGRQRSCTDFSGVASVDTSCGSTPFLPPTRCSVLGTSVQGRCSQIGRKESDYKTHLWPSLHFKLGLCCSWTSGQQNCNHLLCHDWLLFLKNPDWPPFFFTVDASTVALWLPCQLWTCYRGARPHLYFKGPIISILQLAWGRP